MTRNSAGYLEQAVRSAAGVADEIVIGVDDSSSDETWNVAQSLADVTYRFRNPGHLAPVRMLPFEYAGGDWIFSLDDDEGLEDSCAEIVREMLSVDDLTHWWLPRKTIIATDPFCRVDGPEWYPDWQLRIFRNDASLVWKPPRYHSGYQVMGPGGKESRTAILHYDLLLRTPEEMEAKGQMYLAGGSPGIVEAYRRRARDMPTLPTPQPTPRPPVLRTGKRVEETLRVPELRALPPWGVTIHHVEHPAEALAGAHLVAEVQLQNTGGLAWHPYNGRWPGLGFSYHLEAADGRSLQWDHRRELLPYPVAVGGESHLLYSFTVPETAGDYWLDWDLVSEGECWFQECGSKTLRTPLHVRSVTADVPASSAAADSL